MYNTNYGGYQFPQMPMPQPAPQPTQPKMLIAFVNGIEEAKGYTLATNTIAFLIDTQSPTMFRKTTDEMGMATFKEFEVNEKTETPPVEYVTKTEYQTLLEKVDKLTTKPIVQQSKPIVRGEYEQQQSIIE